MKKARGAAPSIRFAARSRWGRLAPDPAKWATLAAIVALTTAVAVAAPLKPGETRIAGRTYLFTPDLYQGGIVETGRIGDMLLELAWPEMRGLTAEERAMWPPRPTLLILANSAAQTAGDAAPADYILEGIDNELSIAISPRVGEHSIPHRTERPSRVPSPGSGMIELERGKDSPGAVGADVYALPPLDHTAEFIACTRTDKVFTNSTCAQRFVENDMIMKITYDRPLVDQWRAIHDRVASFLRSHEVN